MKKIFINGKFTAQPTTGVQRMARCNIEALDAAIVASGSIDNQEWILLCPPNGDFPKLNAIKVIEFGSRKLGLHFWEQVYLPFASIGGMLVSFSGSTPLLKWNQVFTIHDAAVFDYPKAYTYIFRNWYKFLFKTVKLFAKKIITVSEFSKTRIVDCLKIDDSRILVIHCGHEHLRLITEDSSVWRELNLENTRYLLAVASFNPSKNLLSLIEAFNHVSNQDIKLILVGSSYMNIFSESGVTLNDERVVFTGAVNDGQLKFLYSNAEALVFPSVYEGFGIPPLEAMYCGCPVLAADAASIPEVCGNAAYYFDPYSVSSITSAITNLLDGIVPKQKLVEQGYQRLESFTWKNNGAVLLKELRKLNSYK